MPEDTKPSDQAAKTTPAGGSTLPPRVDVRPQEPAKKRRKKEKKKYDSFVGYLWGEWIRPLGVIFIVMGLFRLTVYDWFDVPSGSMEPTIMTGDRIVVEKFAFGLRVPFTKDVWISQWDRPERGELVVCYSPDRGDEVRLVKRVVAVPGDTIEMRNGWLWINGQEPSKSDIDPSAFPYMFRDSPSDRANFSFHTEMVGGYGHYVMFQKSGAQSIRNFPATTVPEDQYVIIGDNRDNSKDSRQWNMSPTEWGTRVDFMDVDRIQGRAFAVAFSLEGFVPRWERFFKGLR